MDKIGTNASGAIWWCKKHQLLAIFTSNDATLKLISVRKNDLSSGSVSELFWTEECCPEQNPTHLNMVKYMSKQVFTIKAP